MRKRSFFIDLMNSRQKAVVDISDAANLLAMGSWARDQGYAQHRWTEHCRTHRVRMHQVLIGSIPPGWVIDHINGNRLDNRRANLRILKKAENAWNLSPRSRHGPSGCRGIAWNAKIKRWQVAFNKDHLKYSLGCYEPFDEALALGTLAIALLFGRCSRFYDDPRFGRDFDEVCARAPETFAMLSERARWYLGQRLRFAVHRDSVGLFARLSREAAGKPRPMVPVGDDKPLSAEAGLNLR